MGTIVGIVYPEGPATAPKDPEKEAAKKGGRPTKAELLAKAEALGVDVPEGATNPQIAELIDEAAKDLEKEAAE